MSSKACWRLGVSRPMWLKTFKIAIIQKDVPQIEALLDKMPPFSTPEEMEEAAYQEIW